VILSETRRRDPLLRETRAPDKERSEKSNLITLFTQKEAIYPTLDYYGPDCVHFCHNLVFAEKQSVYLEPFKGLQKGVKAYFPEIRIV
jgi:phosphoribosylanthranilate isomerase